MKDMGKSKVVERWRKTPLTPPPPGIVVFAVVINQELPLVWLFRWLNLIYSSIWFAVVLQVLWK